MKRTVRSASPASGPSVTCGEPPDVRGVFLGRDTPLPPPLRTHPAGNYMRRQLRSLIHSTRSAWICGRLPLRSAPKRRSSARAGNTAFWFHLSVKPELIMPRSFLVKKYFSNKKPFYRESQLESQTAYVPESFAQAELPTQNSSFALTCFPTGPFFSAMDVLPAPLSPIAPASPSPSPLRPLDLSSSPSSSEEEEEEDGGRTSDPPSPDAMQHAFHCLHCTSSYTSLSALSHHQTSHHQTSRPSAEGPARPAFHCKHCPKEYTSLGALKMHIRSHTLPCVCPTCGKAFSRPWLLRGHIRTHTGERPFACQHCNRAFADRSNLRAHLQTHSEVKKYQCGSCSRTFSRMSLLLKHSASGCCPAS